MLSLLRHGSGLLAPAARSLGASAGLMAAGISTRTAVLQQSTDPNDPAYVFKDHCRGQRAVSKEAEELIER